MNEVTWQLAILANVVIALAYLGIGLYVAPKFSFAAPHWGAKLARSAGLVFFITCAGTHLELAYHAAQAGPGSNGLAVGEWFVQWHGLFIHTVQGAAGWLFLVLAARYLSVKVYNRDYYDRVVKERVSEIERIQQEAERAREEATRANVAKTAFLSQMSHELRTPLNAILGFSQVLELSQLDAEDREGVAHISQAGRHLLALINDVLDLSRIESGTMTIAAEPVRVTEMLGDILALLQPLAHSRSIRLTTEAQDCAVHVRADPRLLRQVLLNLLSNAVKYNVDGGEVAVSCTRTERGAVRLFVRDTGPGIDADQRDRLFEPFERLGAESSGVEGTGLGLALSKQLIEMMDGAIGVDSAPGAGSTFWIDLPELTSPSTRAWRRPRLPHKSGRVVPAPCCSSRTTPRTCASSRPCCVGALRSQSSRRRVDSSRWRWLPSMSPT